MMGTIYERDYLAEHLQNTVDNLNLLYVAFTRASRHLFVIGKRHAKNTRSALIEMCLPLVAQKMEGATIEGLEDDDADILFEIGSLSLPTKKETTHSENVFLQPSQPELVRIHAYQHPTEYRQSNQSKLFVKGDQEDDVQEGYIQLGSVLHQIFSTIKTVDDVHQAIARLQTEGILYNENITVDKLSDMLHKRLSDPRVADWFSDRWTLFNECTILSVEDGNVVEHRPDRVMTDGHQWIVVDFKFGHPNPEYHDQVRTYMELLRSMGHQQVSGYLWYVYSNKIESV
jgi:ATP-dependent exoDNAse (exonuclease V) beta subunit